MKYDYLKNIQKDILNYLKNNNFDFEPYLSNGHLSEDDLCIDLFLLLKNENSVTGAGNFSYFRNEKKAGEALKENAILLVKCVSEYEKKYNTNISDMKLNNEILDVLIRLILLPQAIKNVVKFLDVKYKNT